MKRIFSTRCTDFSFSFATLLLRVGFGGLLLAKFGFDKLVHFSSKAPHFADPFHIGSIPSFSMVVFAEFFCSLLIVLGLFTRLACIPIIIAMAVALFYANHGDVLGNGANAALFLTAFTALLFLGAGKVSIDRFISGK